MNECVLCVFEHLRYYCVNPLERFYIYNSVCCFVYVNIRVGLSGARNRFFCQISISELDISAGVCTKN